MAQKNDYTYALGRRKSSSATVRLIPSGKGQITINDKDVKAFFDDSSRLEQRLREPLHLLNVDSRYNLIIRVKGGGKSGQADAAKLAISKALASLGDDNRSTLKKAGLLKRDPREKERKKYGLKRARKKEQFSKR